MSVACRHIGANWPYIKPHGVTPLRTLGSNVEPRRHPGIEMAGVVRSTSADAQRCLRASACAHAGCCAPAHKSRCGGCQPHAHVCAWPMVGRSRLASNSQTLAPLGQRRGGGVEMLEAWPRESALNGLGHPDTGSDMTQASEEYGCQERCPAGPGAPPAKQKNDARLVSALLVCRLRSNFADLSHHRPNSGRIRPDAGQFGSTSTTTMPRLVSDRSGTNFRPLLEQSPSLWRGVRADESFLSANSRALQQNNAVLLRRHVVVALRTNVTSVGQI